MNKESNLTKTKPLISVVIPVYNTEKFLPKCLDSIINQTYTQLEIIIVNDCSPGDTKKIVDEYLLRDSRVKYIEHDKNKGLFHARVTGSEIATGEYIAFVDSDDYISIDYYRLLIDKGIKEDADIVEGRIIREDENGYRFIQNFNNILLDKLTGDDIKDQFFSQEGLFYHWHVIWNKIYRMDLWNKCLPYFKNQVKHLIMTEDLIFSSLLFCEAKKYCSIKYDGYFYSIRAEASTGTDIDLNKFLKNFSDMGTAFNFVESYLEAAKQLEKYGENLSNWKKRYFRLWMSRLESTEMKPSAKEQAILELKKALNIHENELALPEDYYHAAVNTPWEHRYEAIKKLIVDDKIEYVSFDIFDTLVVRPFFDPRDLLLILDNYFHQIYPHNNLVEFSTLRLQAEDRTRQLIRLNNPSWQDVNLNEIYEYIRSEYNFPLDIVDKLKAKEIELEIQYTMRRESVYELYQMAKERNKKIIFVSDMYLPGTVIKDIVEKAGYCDYEKIYVSSEARLLKYTGDMFKYVTIDLEINPNSILHIGDNWESDKVMAEKAGWNAFFIAKTLDLLLNNLADKESGNSVKYFNEFRQEQWTSYEHNEYLGTRCMLATVANKLFDNPYISFNPDSDFNVDPYFVGYYALGMHTVGLCKWIVEDAVRKNYNTIHFLARDGYLPHKVYDVISKYYSNAPESNYLYVSRRSMLPYLLSSHNKYGLSSFVSIYSHTPRSILGLFSGVLKNDLKLENFEEKGVILSKNFSSEFEFKKYLDVLIKDGIDWEKTKKYNSNIKEYLSSVIKSNDATFDLGYSARLQTMMVNILGYPCNTYFVHTSKELSKIYSRRNDFEVKSFFELKPSVSGILREHLFAELGPSCIGYEEKSNNLIEPVFEDYYTNHINQLMIKTLQNAAIDFATDFMGCFKDHLSLINIKNHEVSLPLEMYIHSSKQSDRLLFMHSYSDDTVHSGKDKNSVLNWWNAETNKLRIQHLIPEMSEDHQAPPFYFLQYHSRILRIIFFTLFDRDTLKNKVKSRYLGKPLSYKVLSTSYRMLRGFKRMIFK